MDKYKILVFSDMHGNRRTVDIARTILEKDKFDLVVYLGDFSENIGDEKANISDCEYLVSRLNKFAPVKALFGNCDSPELKKFLDEHDLSLHNKIIFQGKSAIIGRGGSHPTPFHTPCEFSESAIEKDLEELTNQAAKGGVEHLVLFTHEPPARTKTDELPSGHVGSEALRHIIDDHQPNLLVCGHIHEAKSIDHIGHTKIINIGQGSHGHFLIVSLDGEVSTEEVNI
jgi:Icc-related predicted phosphoesterase